MKMEKSNINKTKSLEKINIFYQSLILWLHIPQSFTTYVSQQSISGYLLLKKKTLAFEPAKSKWRVDVFNFSTWRKYETLILVIDHNTQGLPTKNDTIHGTGVLTYMNFLIFMVNVGKYIYIYQSMDGIWVMISNLLPSLKRTAREKPWKLAIPKGNSWDSNYLFPGAIC